MDFTNIEGYTDIQHSLDALYSKKNIDFSSSAISNGLLDELHKAGFVDIFNSDADIHPLNLLSLIFKQAGYQGVNLDLYSFFIDIPLIYKATYRANHDFLRDHLSLNSLITSAFRESYQHVEEGLQTRGVKESNGYTITGNKYFIENFHQAKFIILSFQTNEGIKLAFIDKNKVSSEEQTITSGLTVSQIAFEELHIHQECILHIDSPLELINEIDLSQKLIRSMFIEGVSKRMMEMTAKYTAERKQFDRPIATFQAVSHRASSMFIDHECLSLVNQQALFSLINNKSEKENHVLAAKAWSADVSHRSSYSAQHLHGGMGVSKEYDLWKYCLLAKEHEIMHDSAAVCITNLGKNITLNQ
jgi:alkylation response protein AidB-like acyl-CoA dehydrogenase